MAVSVASGAIVGPPHAVIERLRGLQELGFSRFVLYAEAIGQPAMALTSIKRFAAEVRRHFADERVETRPC